MSYSGDEAKRERYKGIILAGIGAVVSENGFKTGGVGSLNKENTTTTAQLRRGAGGAGSDSSEELREH